MDSKIIFSIFIVLLIIQRLVEVQISAKHERSLKEEGAIEYGNDHFIVMKMIHSFWFIFMLAEVWFLDRNWEFELLMFSILGFIIGQVLRITAITQLGRFWTVKVFVLPKNQATASGIYKFIKHPNYLGVILEFAFVPLIHGAWISSLIFSLGNLILLRTRIRIEEKALREHCEYEERMQGKKAFVPAL